MGRGDRASASFSRSDATNVGFGAKLWCSATSHFEPADVAQSDRTQQGNTSYVDVLGEDHELRKRPRIRHDHALRALFPALGFAHGALVGLPHSDEPGAFARFGSRPDPCAHDVDIVDPQLRVNRLVRLRDPASAAVSMQYIIATTPHANGSYLLF